MAIYYITTTAVILGCSLHVFAAADRGKPL